MATFNVTLTDSIGIVIADCWIADTAEEVIELEAANETAFLYETPNINGIDSVESFVMNEISINKKQNEPEVLNIYTPIYAIARVIKKDWKNIFYAAKPYLDAMLEIENINDNYHADSAKTVVLYFLASAGTWKGDTAREVKLLLRKIAGVK